MLLLFLGLTKSFLSLPGELYFHIRTHPKDKKEQEGHMRDITKVHDSFYIEQIWFYYNFNLNASLLQARHNSNA